MPTFIEKIGLQESFTYELDMPQRDFVTRFKKQVDQGDMGFLFDSVDILSSSPNVYKGWVTDRGFSLRKKRKLFSFNANSAVAIGRFAENNQKLQIHTVVTGVNYSFFVFMMVVIAFAFILFTGDFGVPFACLLLLALVSFHYFSIKRNIKSFRRELEGTLRSL